MKLSIKKSGRFTYLYAVKGFRDDRGVSTSKVVKKFGTIEELKERLNGADPVEWVRAQVAEMPASRHTKTGKPMINSKRIQRNSNKISRKKGITANLITINQITCN